MPRKFLSIGFLAVVWLFLGCEIESGENFQFLTLEVTSAELPEAFDHNQQHRIAITFERPDDCTFFHDFDISVVTATERNIVVIGSMLVGDDCLENNGQGEAVLNFTAIETVPYTFRFYTGVNENGEPEYLEYIVPVR